MLLFHNWNQGGWTCGDCLYWEPNSPKAWADYKKDGEPWDTRYKHKCLHPFSEEDSVGRGRSVCDFFIYCDLFDYSVVGDEIFRPILKPSPNVRDLKEGGRCPGTSCSGERGR